MLKQAGFCIDLNFVILRVLTPSLACPGKNIFKKELHKVIHAKAHIYSAQ